MYLQKSPIHPQKSPIYQFKRIYVCASSEVSREPSHSRPRVRAPVCSLTRAHARAHPCALSLAPTRVRTRVFSHSRPRTRAPVCSLTRAHACTHVHTLVCVPHAHTHSPSLTQHTHAHTRSIHESCLFTKVGSLFQQAMSAGIYLRESKALNLKPL